MAAALGQQVVSIASSTLKIASALTISDASSWWNKARPQVEIGQKTFTLEEVSWHWEPNDCWMVIYDKVYDMTDLLSEHPGGYEVLLEHAGRDATIAFRGVGHSQQALVDMEKYLIGELVESEKMNLSSRSR